MTVPDLARWDRLSESQCLDVARDLVVPGFAFDRLVRSAQGDAARWVAVFRHRSGAEFALVPGGPTTLGYDTARPLVFDTEATSSWDTSMSEFGMPSLPTYLSEVLQPARQVTIAPSLIEITARSIGDAIGEPDDDDDSSAHERVVAALAADGLRLLTADEWEHACSGGTRTLWRWGDACPGDCEPFGQIPFAELRRPNAFGLVIAQNPYDWEYIDDPDEMRGVTAARRCAVATARSPRGSPWRRRTAGRCSTKTATSKRASFVARSRSTEAVVARSRRQIQTRVSGGDESC